jgi:ribonuclease D
VKEKLDEMLARDHRAELAHACFAFLPARAKLDLGGWSEEDIFSHS